MNIIYESDINYLKEANDLLLRNNMQHEKFKGVLMSDIESIAEMTFSRYPNIEAYEEFKEQFVKPICYLTNIGITASQSILDDFKEFYFVPCFSNFYSVGSLICNYISIESSLEKKELPDNDKQNILQLRTLGSVTITDVIDYNDTKQSIFDAVEQSFETDKEKWQFIKIIQDIQFYKKEFLSLIEPVVLVLKKEHHIFEKLTMQCINRIQLETKQSGVQSYFEKWNLKIQDDLSVTLRPLVFRFGDLSYSTLGDIPSIQFGVACDYLHFAYGTLSGEQLFIGLKALGDRKRFEIMKLLAQRSYYGQELAQELSLTPATISHHMEMIINCGFVQVQHDGTKIMYSISREHILKIIHSLQEEFYGDELIQ